MSCPQIIIIEYNQTYLTSPFCYYVLDLLCVISFISNLDIFLFENWRFFYNEVKFIENKNKNTQQYIQNCFQLKVAAFYTFFLSYKY